jgi:glucan 1,3-beta-glucosidase
MQQVLVICLLQLMVRVTALPPTIDGLSTLAELEGRQSCSLSPTNPSGYWYESITHNGISPFIPLGSSWPVFRNVKNSPYNAAGDNVTNDAPAFQAAINAGNSFAGRNNNSLGTTGQPAVVYVPSGTYYFAGPIQLYVGMILMGDPINPPTIRVGNGFSGSTVIKGMDPAHSDAVTSFYTGVKNIVIDSYSLNKDTTVTLLEWSIAQGCQLTNVVFNMPPYSTGHTGVGMPHGGSALMINDCTFNGGVVGINVYTQQYHFKGLTFSGCNTGILVSSIKEMVIQGATFLNCGTGVDTTALSSGVPVDGFVALIDSTAASCGTLVKMAASSNGQDSVVLENIITNSVTSTVKASGTTILTGGVAVGKSWVYGNAYTPGGPGTGAHQTGTLYTTSRSGVLVDGSGKYHVVPPPTYKEYDVTEFVNVKSISGYPVAGDGMTDDTTNLQAIINANAGCKILFFPYGTYLVTNTLFFPAGSRVFGEAWSAISASGSNFWNPAAPVPMVKVGNTGDVGVAQFSDMIFTVSDVLQGCTLLEVNMAGANPGDVGFWNTHFRVGGAAGSSVQTHCGGSGGGGTPAQCKAAFMLAHLTASSSAYIENMWAWTADHDIDVSTLAVASLLPPALPFYRAATTRSSQPDAECW